MRINHFSGRFAFIFMALLFALTAGGCGVAGGTAANSAASPATAAENAASNIPPQPAGRYIEKVFAELDVTDNIQYGIATNESGLDEKLCLDIYQPKGDTQERRPAVIFVHGGGFTGGDKDGGIEAELARILARKGYVTLSINYRLRTNPSADWAGAFRDADSDAYAAFQWLVQHKDEYRIDTGHIAFGGHSAGANIVTDLCYSDWSGKPVSKDGVFAVISMAGPQMIFGAPEPDDPFDIIIQGVKDELVPASLSEGLSNRMDSIGTPHVLDMIPNCYHDMTPALHEVEDVVTSYLYKTMTGKEAGIVIRKYTDEVRQIPIDRLAQQPVYTACNINGVKLDGKLDEWGKAAPMLLNQLKDAGSSLPAPEDCTATGYAAWDPGKPNCLYMAMTVTDDVFQEAGNPNFWENDNMELLVDLGQDSASVPFLQWVANINGKEINYIHCDSESCEVAVSRQGNTVTFEMMVDLSQSLPELAGYTLSGKTIGFCLCYDDCEEGARQHQVGLVAGKTLDPRNFANLKVAEQ